MRYPLGAATLVAVMAFVLPAQGDVPSFDDHWYDGKAELSGYKLRIERYGQVRDGECVMVFVTEPFSESKRVKVDDHRKNPSDTFTALKLNLVRDFTTGIYDYNTMVSTFVRAETFEPVKVTFSSAEWCGHVFNEMRFYNGRVEGRYHSYFEDESGEYELDNPDRAVSEDNLFILLRGLRGHFLEPGQSTEVPYLPGVLYARFAHRRLAWSRATITRDPETRSVDVPAGSFDAIVYRVDPADGRRGTFYIEAKYPHRIVRWELAPDVSGELTGSTRLEYWRLNQEGDERYRDALGL